mgnify:CR=1 FL=1
MFTGIIQAKGRIKKIEKVGGDKRLLIDAAGLPLADLELGAHRPPGRRPKKNGCLFSRSCRGLGRDLRLVNPLRPTP